MTHRKLNRRSRRRNDRRRRTGFTLMEVLLVLMILVVLASMAVTIFGGTQERALKDAAKTQVGTLQERRRATTVFTPRIIPAASRTSSTSRATVRSPSTGTDRTSTSRRFRSIPGTANTNSPRRASITPSRSTSGRWGPTSRTAPTTTSATGNRNRDQRDRPLQCTGAHSHPPNTHRYRLPSSLPSRMRDAPHAGRGDPCACAVGGDQRGHGAAALRFARARAAPAQRRPGAGRVGQGPAGRDAVRRAVRLSLRAEGEPVSDRARSRRSRPKTRTTSTRCRPRTKRTPSMPRPTCCGCRGAGSWKRLYSRPVKSRPCRNWRPRRRRRKAAGRSRSCSTPTAPPSDAAVLLANSAGSTLRVTLRGLTGISRTSEIGSEATP